MTRPSIDVTIRVESASCHLFRKHAAISGSKLSSGGIIVSLQWQPDDELAPTPTPTLDLAGQRSSIATTVTVMAEWMDIYDCDLLVKM